MTSSTVQPRTSAEVLAQLEAFEAVLRDTSPPPPGDFAAELPWEAWQNHRAELERELAAAEAVDSVPVTELGHGLLSDILAQLLRVAEKPLTAVRDLISSRARH